MNDTPDPHGTPPGVPGVPLEELLKDFVARAGELIQAQERTRGLLEAVVAVAEDLGLESVLERVVASACDLLRARYGALGVIGEDGGLSHFITVGIDEDLASRIGPLPTGHGVLGLLITDPLPLRLHDLSRHPNAYGFPKHHPPMKSFLGVPVRVRDKVFGNLYLTEKDGGEDFTPEDEDLAVALAAAAGVAIENARLYEDARRRTSWLEACMDITGRMLDDGRPEGASLDLIAERAMRESGAELALVLLPSAEQAGEYTVEGHAGRDDGMADAAPVKGRVLSVASTGIQGRNDGSSSTVQDPWRLFPVDRAGQPGTLLAMDLSAQGDHQGILVLGRSSGKGAFSTTDVEMASVYGSHIALALALDRIHRLREQQVVFSDRDRIARDLHDLVIQRLFAAGLSIQSLRRFGAAPSVEGRINAITDELDTSIRDLRNTIYSLRATGDDRELLSTRIMQTIQTGAKALTHAPHLTLTGAIDSLEDDVLVEHLLAVLTESLSNAVRHSGAETITVSVAVEDDALTMELADNGCGFSETGSGNGLDNMVRRAAELNGSCIITSTPGKGTSLTWTVPLR
ncbi:GAF domain-containing sensor histidine kinase [Paenarthrobacter nicotinovorans]|uniref:GAF domain-containing sensor histidine kinase n=1 Tax=Paenarthrobacter nicotinovorans TaxID=29320 RepID=UPI0009A67259|nr:GAF domain-containing sensor histidine kinase [Paenarthrobacter nicotinovorans]MDI2019616.1 Oxygen sensor histidine kinase response regulator DevS/DosS [Paenarthrobacter nicotinovorans]SKB55834.1 Histidine kinase-, DNA gyrase B-, and HSP90-like ATPase [Arthrobacter sp. 31Cvi3.1E]